MSQSPAKVYRAKSVITDKFQVEVTARNHREKFEY